MNSHRAVYVMLAITMVLVGVAIWAAGTTTRVVADFKVLQEAQRSTRSAQLTACERGNVLRTKLDVQVAAVAAIGDEFAEWLESSAQFRESQGETIGAAESRVSKRRVDGFVALLVPVGQVDCQRVIP